MDLNTNDEAVWIVLINETSFKIQLQYKRFEETGKVEV